MKIKEKLKSLQVGDILTPVALIVIGLLFAIFPDRSATVVCYCVGAVLCVLGVIGFADYFTKGRRTGSRDLALAVFYISTALILFIKPALIAEIITVVFGIALIVNGALKIQLFFDLGKFHAKNRWFVLVLALISFVLGALMAFDPFSSKAALMIFAGVSLIVDGVLDLFSVLLVPEKREVDESKVIDLDDDDISGV